MNKMKLYIVSHVANPVLNVHEDLGDEDVRSSLEVISFNRGCDTGHGLQTHFIDSTEPWFAEYEALRHVYNRNFSGLQHDDVVGFVHHDHIIKKGFLRELRAAFEFRDEDIVMAFNLMPESLVRSTNVTLSEDRSAVFSPGGKNILDMPDPSLALDYVFMGKRPDHLPMCSAFAASFRLFCNAMLHCEGFIARNDINSYDPSRANRYQGHIIERYLGMLLSVENVRSIPVRHLFSGKPIDKE